MTTVAMQQPRVEGVRALSVPPGPSVPNNAADPAILAKNALGGPRAEKSVEALFRSNGWTGTWTWEVFEYHHFHPDAFEALGVASGSATLMLGGPQGETVEVEAGDVIILPPGFGHRQVAKSDDFRICGAYPPGQEDYSLIHGEEGYDDEVSRVIADAPPPETDPVWGGRGPLLERLLGTA